MKMYVLQHLTTVVVCFQLMVVRAMSSPSRTLPVEVCVKHDVCYTFYNVTGGVTWSEANSLCDSEDQRLAVIGDYENAIAVTEYVQTFPSLPLIAWVSGKKAKRPEWVDLTGARFGGVIEAAPNGSCGVYSWHDDGIHGRHCTITRGTSKLPICQYTSDTCLPDSVRIENLCYIVPEDNFNTWHDAREFCQFNYPEGSLAYGALQAAALKNYIDRRLSSPKVYSRTTELWVGVRQFHWRWRTEENPVIQYEVAENLPDDSDQCLAVQFGVKYHTWRGFSCEDKLSNYMCMRIDKPPVFNVDTDMRVDQSRSRIDISLRIPLGIFTFTTFLLTIVIIVQRFKKSRQKWTDTTSQTEHVEGQWSREAQITPTNNPGEALANRMSGDIPHVYMEIIGDNDVIRIIDDDQRVSVGAYMTTDFARCAFAGQWPQSNFRRLRIRTLEPVSDSYPDVVSSGRECARLNQEDHTMTMTKSHGPSHARDTYLCPISAGCTDADGQSRQWLCTLGVAGSKPARADRRYTEVSEGYMALDRTRTIGNNASYEAIILDGCSGNTDSDDV